MNLWLSCLVATSQDNHHTLVRLSPEQVMSIMRKYHPIIRQANIQVTLSENDITRKKSSFDPALSGKTGAKNLKNEEYYQSYELGIEIPTWYGIDIEAGTTNIEGRRLDNSVTTGSTSYIGVKIPLLQNLIYDKRRGYLEQAKIMNKLSIHERRKIVNDAMLDAMKAYWKWVKAYETFKIMDELVEINLARLKFVKQSISHGERPAIDSIEVKTQWISFQIEKENRWTDFLNAGNELSIFLWKENETPYSLPKTAIPIENWDKKFRSISPNLNYEALINEGTTNHPEIKMYEEQLNFYRIQKKIYFQELLPKLDLKYRILNNTEPQNFSIMETRPFVENYQYSLKLEIPLRLSEGRMNFKSAKLKINHSELALQQKAQSLTMKIKTYYNNYLNLEKLTRLQFENYENYSTMVKAEDTRFKMGESNLFIINARENKAREELVKLIELKTKYFNSIYELKWSAGLLF